MSALGHKRTLRSPTVHVDLQPEVDLAAALECFPGIVAVLSQFDSRKAPRLRNRALPDTAEWRSLLLSRVAGRPRVPSC
jgi:hypothetical protein